MSVKGKIVVITGGSGTLGMALAQGLAEEGAIIYLLARNEINLIQKVDFLKDMYLDATGISCDVLNSDSVNSAVEQILARSGRIDILINGAGGNLQGATIRPDQSLFDLNIEEFKKVSELNLFGTVIPTIAFAKPMVNQKRGCIINISSMSAQLPLTRVVGYSAAKAAVDNFTRSMAVELATKYGEGIRVNAVAPGFFIADQNKNLLLNFDGTLTDRGNTILSQTPFKRFGDPKELISTILWLADDRSSFITGIVVPVDGGFSAFSGV